MTEKMEALRVVRPLRIRRLAPGKCALCDKDGAEGPSHDASEHCESGKRPHCSCDVCF